MALKLPPLLQERREKYDIPDACFRQVALFDRVLLWQVPLDDVDADKVAPGSTLFAPQTAQDRKLTTAPRGVIVTAGLKAMDYLWANGIGLGSIVKFVRLSPWHMPVTTVDGKEMYLQVVRVGDLVACEDLATNPVEVEADQHGVHQVKIDGRQRPRVEPDAYDDY